MVTLLGIGLFFIVLSGIVNIIELKPFFRELAQLNANTTRFGDKMLYPFRFIGNCLPKMAPIIPDVILIALGGGIGFGNGVTGGIIGIGGSCLIALLIKAALWMAKREANSVA